MMRKKRTGAVCAVLALMAVLLILWGWTQRAGIQEAVEEELVITAFPVGKADAILIRQGGQTILIDTGEADDGDDLLQEFHNRGIQQIDLLVITHYDKDHVGGAARIMEQMEVESVLIPDYAGTRPEYTAFLAMLDGQDQVQRLTDQVSVKLGEMALTVWPAEGPEEIQNTDGEYDNDMSLVISLTYGQCRFLLTGDIEKTRIAQMLATDVNWEHDWIKMPHHGKYQKILKDLMDEVHPEYAVICCSKEEPAEEKTLDMLAKKRISVWNTSEQAVVTVSDGEKIQVRYQ